MLIKGVPIKFRGPHGEAEDQSFVSTVGSDGESLWRR
jgi:hypothetical protein